MATLEQLETTLRALPNEIATSIVREQNTKGVHEALRRAWQYSSGPFSLLELARMDHPYARRHGRPHLNPEVVNAQTGLFRSQWRPVFHSRRSAHIENADPKARYLQDGTDTMFPRPIDKRIKLAIQPVENDNFRVGTDRAMLRLTQAR